LTGKVNSDEKGKTNTFNGVFYTKLNTGELSFLEFSKLFEDVSYVMFPYISNLGYET
jgi:hypothetical protein